MNEYDNQVGYQVRFEKTRVQSTRIIFMTEGILLRQLQTDSALSDYDILVIDEVHERHLFTDFILGIIKCLITQRKDLKVILMSATINIDLFSKYFDDCPVVKVRRSMKTKKIYILFEYNHRYRVVCIKSMSIIGQLKSKNQLEKQQKSIRNHIYVLWKKLIIK